jgi:hypothetical protein
VPQCLCMFNCTCCVRTHVRIQVYMCHSVRMHVRMLPLVHMFMLVSNSSSTVGWQLPGSA